MSEEGAVAQTSFMWRHVLYRFFDDAGELLYVGITQDLNGRFRRHAARQPWWGEVADCRTEFLPSRLALERAERAAIRRERPRYNKRLVPRPAPKRSNRAPSQRVDALRFASKRTWQNAGYTVSSIDPSLVINKRGDVLRPTKDAGVFDIVCAGPMSSSGFPGAGHERCWVHGDKHRCRIYQPVIDSVRLPVMG